MSCVGDGVVTYAGWKGDYGRFVRIKHNSAYTTTYGHLSRIEKGIRRGKRVRQGDKIGYVGSTGLSTGPHLDFRITKRGRYVNFLKLKFPPARNVPKNYKEEFNITKERVLELLESMG